MAQLQPKQFNIAHGPQGQRWDAEMTRADDRWRSVAVREHGKAYAEDVTRTHLAAEEGTTANTAYFPGQGTSQGKLFHDPKPTDPHRWPRGYTPERQSDVDVSFVSSRFTRSSSQDAMVARAKDTIARSDMPERDLSRVSKGYEDPVKIAAQAGGGGAYHDETRLITLNTEAGDTTTMHEVGHAVSSAQRLPGVVGAERVTSDWEQAVRAGGHTFARVAGAEEARADIYARHTRQKDGTPDLRNSDYSPSDDYLRIMNRYGDDAEATFYKEYDAEHGRRGVPRPSQAALDAAKVRSAEGRAELQQQNALSSQLLFRRVSKSVDDPTPDYGQYGYTDYSGQENIGTIRSGRGVPPEIEYSVEQFKHQKEQAEKARRGW